MSALDEKMAAALKAISEALAGGGRPAVLLRGDAPGALLVHLVVKAMGGGRGLEVIFAPSDRSSVKVGRYVDKLRRLWGFHITALGGADDPAMRAMERGVGTLFTYGTGVFGGGAAIERRDGLMEVRPLISLGAEEIDALFGLERLPACSAWQAGRAETWSEHPGTRPEDSEEVVRRLAALGYM